MNKNVTDGEYWHYARAYNQLMCLEDEADGRGFCWANWDNFHPELPSAFLNLIGLNLLRHRIYLRARPRAHEFASEKWSREFRKWWELNICPESGQLREFADEVLLRISDQLLALNN